MISFSEINKGDGVWIDESSILVVLLNFCTDNRSLCFM